MSLTARRAGVTWEHDARDLPWRQQVFRHAQFVACIRDTGAPPRSNTLYKPPVFGPVIVQAKWRETREPPGQEHQEFS
jgi:hypothetical protein